ncbi:hypothetical protein RvY_05572-2 [Ramazzottius varieornatus]|uniref:Uncharacterized protein n=1 Tax=Ramazzottius varieornatus TaxID=947166 RepID=A0A1D1V141_RAMVA|nr:hypothetical protein RvY_05572-2 [Ramazzottius varieornatus]
MHSRLSLEDPNLDDHIKATIRRLSKFSAGSAGLPITSSEVDRVQKSYVSAYSTPLGDTIVEEGVIEYADTPDKSTSLDALDGQVALDQSYVHPKVFTSPKTGSRNTITP